MYWFPMFEGIVAHEEKKVKRKMKKFRGNEKSRPKRRIFFIPLSFLLRVLILINESVELS